MIAAICASTAKKLKEKGHTRQAANHTAIAKLILKNKLNDAYQLAMKEKVSLLLIGAIQDIFNCRFDNTGNHLAEYYMMKCGKSEAAINDFVYMMQRYIVSFSYGLRKKK